MKTLAQQVLFPLALIASSLAACASTEESRTLAPVGSPGEPSTSIATPAPDAPPSATAAAQPEGVPVPVEQESADDSRAWRTVEVTSDLRSRLDTLADAGEASKKEQRALLTQAIELLLREPFESGADELLVLLDVEEIAALWGHGDEQRVLIERCIEVEHRDDLRSERWRAIALRRLAGLLDVREEGALALELHQEAVDILRLVPELPPGELFIAEVDLWRALDRLERRGEADACLAVLIDTSARLHDAKDEVANTALLMLALDLEGLSRRREALALEKSALRVFDASGMFEGETHLTVLLDSIGVNEFNTGDPRAARVTFGRMLEIQSTNPAGDVQMALRARVHIARCDAALGEFDAAIASLEAMLLEIPEALSSDDPLRVSAEMALVTALADGGRVPEALSRAIELLAVLREHRPTGDQDVEGLGAIVAQLTGRLGGGEAVYAALKDHLASIEADTNATAAVIAEARENLAIAATELDRPEEALVLMQSVSRERALLYPPDHRANLTAAQNLAVVLAMLGRYEEARELEERTLAVRLQRLSPTAEEVLESKLNLAQRCTTLGAFERARELRQDVLAAMEERYASKSQRVLTAKYALAIAYRDAGDYESARALLEGLVAHYEDKKSRNRATLITYKHDLAWTLHLAGDSARAIALQGQVLDELRAERSPTDIELNTHFQNMATMRRAAGDLPGARALAAESLAFMQDSLGETADVTLAAMANMAVILKSEGDTLAAGQLEERVLANLRATPGCEELQVLRAIANLANTRFMSGQFEEAAQLRREVLERRLALLPPDHTDVARSRMSLAGSLQAMGQYGEALAELDSACATHQRRSELAGVEAVVALVNRFSVLTRAKVDYDPRVELAVVADAIEATMAPAIVSSPRAVREWQSSLLETLGNVASLDDATLQGGEGELLRAIESLRVAVTERVDVQRMLSLRPELTGTQRELERVVRTISQRALHMPGGAEALAAWERDVRDLVERRDRLQATLVEGSSPSERPVQAVSIESIASSLDERSYFVSFLAHAHAPDNPSSGAMPKSLETVLTAFVVDDHARVQIVRLGSIDRITSLVERWRSALGGSAALRSPGIGLETDMGADAQAIGDELRQVLLDPVLERTPDAAILHVIPDALVHLVPLDALPSRTNGVVGDAIRIRILVDAHGLAATEGPADDVGRLVVVGGIDFDASSGVGGTPTAERSDADAAFTSDTRSLFVALPGAAAEARAVATLHEEMQSAPSTLLEGALASKERVVAELSGARFVHLASHGWQFGGAEPSNSIAVEPSVGWRNAAGDGPMSFARVFMPESLCGVALAGANHGPDGILTAEELAMIDLTDCQLAVLSACDTNVGVVRAGQSVQSLKFALHAAGVRTSITSLWRVDDAATQQLFEHFYSKLWRDGCAPADALWQAKQALRADGRPPRDWAGWVLTGDLEWARPQ